MKKIEQFIRQHEMLMCFLAVIYNFFCLNRIKGRRALKLKKGGVFLYRSKFLNYGKNNTIIFEKGCRVYKSRIRIYGNNNSIFVNKDCVLKNVDIWISDGSVIEIGHNTHFTGNIHIACTEGKRIYIGERCLFSNQITLRTGDSHSILNKKGQRINHAEDIYIGAHVWVGQQVIILKGAKVEEESIIGTNALVTGKVFPKHSILAGIPAKVIKDGITWDHRLL